MELELAPGGGYTKVSDQRKNPKLRFFRIFTVAFLLFLAIARGFNHAGPIS